MRLLAGKAGIFSTAVESRRQNMHSAPFRLALQHSHISLDISSCRSLFASVSENPLCTMRSIAVVARALYMQNNLLVLVSTAALLIMKLNI